MDMDVIAGRVLQGQRIHLEEALFLHETANLATLSFLAGMPFLHQSDRLVN